MQNQRDTTVLTLFLKKTNMDPERVLGAVNNRYPMQFETIDALLLKAINGYGQITDEAGKAYTLTSIEQLPNINAGQYIFRDPRRFPDTMRTYGANPENLEEHEQFIYAALLFYISSEETMKLLQDIQNAMVNGTLEEQERLRDNKNSMILNATCTFVSDYLLPKPPFLDRLYNFFKTPSLGRNLLIITGLVLVTLAIVAATVATGGAFGAAATGLGSLISGGVFTGATAFAVGATVASVGIVGGLSLFYFTVLKAFDAFFGQEKEENTPSVMPILKDGVKEDYDNSGSYGRITEQTGELPNPSKPEGQIEDTTDNSVTVSQEKTHDPEPEPIDSGAIDEPDKPEKKERADPQMRL